MTASPPAFASHNLPGLIAAPGDADIALVDSNNVPQLW
jgi:hypothetical protein